MISIIQVSNGEPGLASCPGKKQAAAMTDVWDRDMELDLITIEESGTTSVISLLEPFEYQELGVPNLPEEFFQRFHWLKLPIPDQQAPDNAWTENWETIRTDIKNGLYRGGRNFSSTARAVLAAPAPLPP